MRIGSWLALVCLAAAAAAAGGCSDTTAGGMDAAIDADVVFPIADPGDPADGDAAPADGDAAPTDGDASPVDGDVTAGDGDTAPTDADTALPDADTALPDADTALPDADTALPDADAGVVGADGDAGLVDAQTDGAIGDAESDADVAACPAGAQHCLDAETLTVCVDGAWESAPCDAGSICHDGYDQCLTPCELSALYESNEGCSFWLVQLGNNGNEGYDGGSDTPKWTAGAEVFVVNPNDVEVALTLSSWASTHDLGAAATVAPHATTLFALPIVAAGDVPNKFVVDGASIGYQAFELGADLPVVVYQFNPDFLNILSSDASLVLPAHALGHDYRVIAPAHGLKEVYGEVHHHPGRFTVIATADDTEVTVSVSAATAALSIGAWDAASGAEGHDLSALAAGDERTFALGRHQVLQLESAAGPDGCVGLKAADPEHGTICIDADNFVTGAWCNVYARLFCQPPGADLTGTRVSASKPVAVFGGAKNAMVPYWMFGTEHLEEQLLPIDRWGTHYVAARLEPRYRYYACSRGNHMGDHTSTCPFGSGVSFYKVVAAADDTVVTIRTGFEAVTVDEAPNDWNLHNQVDWVTSVASVGGLPCEVVDGHCAVTVTLQAGEHFAFADVFSHEIVATGRVLVGRFMPGEEYVGIPYSDAPGAYEQTLMKKGGDPAFSVLIPVAQFKRSYTFYIEGGLAYGYLNLTAKVGDTLVLDEGMPAEVVLDTTDGSWEATTGDHVTRIYEIHNLSTYDPPQEQPGAASTTVVEGGGAHTIRSLGDERFGLEVYGFDHYVSYLYPGGLHLRYVDVSDESTESP